MDVAWTDTSVYRDDGTNCTVRNISVLGVNVPAGVWPDQAKEVMQRAGTTTTFPSWPYPPSAQAPLWLPLARARRGGGWSHFGS